MTSKEKSPNTQENKLLLEESAHKKHRPKRKELQILKLFDIIENSYVKEKWNYKVYSKTMRNIRQKQEGYNAQKQKILIYIIYAEI